MSANTNTTKTAGFSAEEREAMKARAKELAAEAKASKKKSDGEQILLDAVAAMPEADKTLATRIHKIVTENAPELWPKTWYGMPAYATKEGKVVCFFQAASKFEARYASFGFNDSAHLDAGNMWPVAFALTKLTADEEKKIAEMVRKSVS